MERALACLCCCMALNDLITSLLIIDISLPVTTVWIKFAILFRFSPHAGEFTTIAVIAVVVFDSQLTHVVIGEGEARIRSLRKNWLQ
ncbi:hypothetical protein F4821DRAFT_236096 [Hypoxylon rubiginosum]|uniref:Uncharacterized protein n=1 Tax=Hypoxylon rubiginosum TaxID=110542 RepID=A0ACC0D4R8_9PEZI|nr:hypothetical protein F4821DRAFT_236096 [Hypoxylon rubiginosum]